VQGLVLDVSVTVAWFVPDENTSISQQVLHRVAEHGAVVPLIWPVEVGNALTMAVRRGRMLSSQRLEALQHLATLQLSSDDQTLGRIWGDALDLADRFRLTLYDACYLELALRLRLPLASLDRELRAAGQKAGLELLGL
jgi:predicted nucleic acid-binding protein